MSEFDEKPLSAIDSGEETNVKPAKEQDEIECNQTQELLCEAVFESNDDAPPKKPRIWTLFAAAFAYVFFMGVSIAVLFIGFFIARPDVLEGDEAQIAQGVQSALTEPNVFALVVFLTALSGILPALLVGAFSPKKWTQRLKLDKSTSTSPTWAWLGVTLLVGTCSEQIIRRICPPWMGPSETLGNIGKSIEAAPPSSLFLLVLGIGVAAPIGEELFFRGVLQPRLVARWGPMVGILITSVLFAVIHMDIQHSLMVFPTGLCLGWMSYRTGSIRAAIAVHMGNNVFATVFERALPSLPSWANGAAIAVIVVFGLLCLALLYRKNALPGQWLS
ncbi:MAG: CPBP family intramembrane metalloprotease [Deltaproteobacteria bacterium]|nr:CPBP family intramembrane metalloprotease [Deltaproteobacteria bacterium]